MSAEDQSKAVASIGIVSQTLREAIAASFPVAPEQYLTIGIPGTVIDLTPVEQGGTYVYDESKYVIPPSQVRQAEAKLVDGMMPLSKVMIGNTGKSVARSYSEALDSLIARKSTTDANTGIRSPGNLDYKNAMDYLITADAKTGLTPVEVYGSKQRKWAAAQDEWDQAKVDALKRAQAENPSNVLALQAYNDWNQTHYRRYKTSVQAEWMDWVSNGHKYDVEYNFGIVDVDSIMARLEHSKESMRNATLIDTDGVNEVQGVELTPKAWATMCRTVKKAVPTYTMDQLNFEIARLNKLKTAYQAMQTATTDASHPYPGAPTVSAEEKEAADKAVADSLAGLLTAQATLRSTSKDDETNLQPRSDEVEKKRQALVEAQRKQAGVMEAVNKFNMANGDQANKDATAAWLAAQLLTVDGQLRQLDDKKSALLRSSAPTAPVVIGANKDGLDVASNDAGLADPIFGTRGDAALAVGSAATTDNPWTEITVSISSQKQSESKDEKSWGMSVGGGVGFGLWSVGGNYAHDQSSSDMQSDMSSCDVNISFQALVVNIRRPWLYGELFNDCQLDTANAISPGPEKLKRMLESPQSSVSELAQYNVFPAYPTSFIVAANTTIEFHGNTQHIEQHMSSHSNSGSASVGYGPWSVSSSFHESASHQSFSMEATSTGCKLNFTSPQIIGWVSQILPALPRNLQFEPMVQNIVPR